MFSFFKKKSTLQLLEIKYKKLLEEAFKLSHTDRAGSSAKSAEADAVLKEMELLKKQS